MKKLSILCLIFIYSCTIAYDAETRLIFETRIVNSNDEPIQGVRLNVEVFNSDGLFGNSETISYGETDANGFIRLVFPSPDFDNYNFSVRSSNYFNSNFDVVAINSIQRSDFINYKLAIPKIYRLGNEEATSVYVNYFSSNPNRRIISSTIEGIYSNLTSIYDFDELYISNSYFLAKKNQTIDVKYTVKDLQSGIVQTFVNQYSIGENSVEITINY